jgi:hypothetical protein
MTAALAAVERGAMARKPSYPDDAPVSERAGEAEGGKADAADADDKAGGSKRTRQFVTGAAIGIGSAALVAALLYANRSRKGGDERK